METAERSAASARSQWQLVKGGIAQEATPTSAKVTLMGEVRRLRGAVGNGSSISVNNIVLIGLPLTLLVALVAFAVFKLSGPGKVDPLKLYAKIQPVQPRRL